jgi:uncharacterized protein
MLLDTSGLLCFLDPTDPNHDAARTLFQAADARFTHSYVTTELIALATARRLYRPAVLSLVDDLEESASTQMVWVGRELHRSAMTLLRTQSDKTYSLCDAVSFTLMEARGLTEALTTDHHFEQAGFRRLLTA